MSQIFKPLTSGSPLPPTIPTSFVTDVNSPAIPALNVLNVPGGSTTANNDHGIITDGSSGSNTLTAKLSNRATGSVTTAAAAITTLITLPMSASPGVMYIAGNVQAFNASTPTGASYSFSGCYITTGLAATEIAVEFHDTFQQAAMVTSDIFLSASGNNILLQVQGVVGLSINWNGIIEYRQVS